MIHCSEQQGMCIAGKRPRALHLLVKHSTTEPYLQPTVTYKAIFLLVIQLCVY